MAVRRGVATFYPFKERDPVTINLSKASREDIEAVQRDVEVSRGDLLEHAYRRLRGLPANKDLEKALRDVKR